MMKYQPIVFIVENTPENAAQVKKLNRELGQMVKECAFPEMEITAVCYDEKYYYLHQEFVPLKEVKKIPVQHPDPAKQMKHPMEEEYLNLSHPPYLEAMVQAMYFLYSRLEKYGEEGVKWYTPKVFHFASEAIEFGLNPVPVLRHAAEFCEMDAPYTYQLFADTSREKENRGNWLLWPMTENIGLEAELDRDAVAMAHLTSFKQEMLLKARKEDHV